MSKIEKELVEIKTSMFGLEKAIDDLKFSLSKYEYEKEILEVKLIKERKEKYKDTLYTILEFFDDEMSSEKKHYGLFSTIQLAREAVKCKGEVDPDIKADIRHIIRVVYPEQIEDKYWRLCDKKMEQGWVNDDDVIKPFRIHVDML